MRRFRLQMSEDVERLEMWRQQSEQAGKAGGDGAAPAIASLQAQVAHLEASLEKQRQREAETASMAKEGQSRMEDAAMEATAAMQVRCGGRVPGLHVELGAAPNRALWCAIAVTGCCGREQRASV